MDTTNSRKQKALGRKVRNFDAAKWDSVCRQLVTEISMAKPSQTPDLKAILLETGDRIIAEARVTISGALVLTQTILRRRLIPTQWRGGN